MRGKSWRSAAPAAIVLLAFALRAWAAARSYALEDEYVQLFVALSPASLSSFLRLAAQNPLHLVVDPLLSFLAGRAGSSLFLLRLPPVLLGSATVWLLTRLDERRGVVAAALLAFSLFHIDWSIRVDFYSLLGFLALAQSWALLAGAWPAYAACAVVFAYAHPYAWLVAAIHGIFLAVERRPARAWALSWAAAAVLLAPWALYSTRLLVAGPAFARGLGGASPWAIAALFATTPSTADGLGRPHNLSTAVFAGCWLLSLWRARTAPRGGLMRLAHLTLLLGPVLVLALDYAFGYFFAPRALLWLLPFYLLAVADGALTAWAASEDRRLLILCLAGLAALELGAGYVRTFAAYGEIGRKQTELVEAVRAQARPGDGFVFDSRELAYCFLYEYDPAAFRALPPFRFQGVALESGNVELKGSSGEALIVASPAFEARVPVWRVRGKVGDVFVYPPARATRKGGST